MDPYYEINLMKDGRLMFATSSTSITKVDYLDEVLTIMREKFTIEEGYQIICIRRDGHGTANSL